MDAARATSEATPRERRPTTRLAPLSFIPALDGVRGLAIIAVMLHNLSGMSDPPTALGRALEWGWTGVQLFFVLSGYLITRILLDAGRAPGVLAAFLARRMLRIAPLYYATLFVYFFVVPRVFDAPTVVAAEPHQLWYWLFVSNWGEPLGYGAPGLQHLWSIAVEVQFYLVWPLATLGASDRRLRRLSLTIIFLSLVSLVGIRFAWDASSSAVYKFTVTRLCAPVMGGFVALVTKRRPWIAVYERIRARLAWGSFAALAALVAWRHGFSHTDPAVQTIGYALVAFVFAQWLLEIVLGLPAFGGATLALPSWRPLRAIGRLSYGMYILHYPLHWAAMKPLRPWLLAGPASDLRQALYIVVAMAATTGLAWVSWMLFERHFIALKRFFPVPRPERDLGAAGYAPPFLS